MKVQRVPSAKHGAHAPTIVAAIHALDFEHLGAQVGKDGPGKGARQNLPQFNDAQPTQGTWVCG